MVFTGTPTQAFLISGCSPAGRKTFQLGYPPGMAHKTPGVVPAINIAVKALTKENDAVLINQPVYHPFHAAVTQNNRKLINSPLILKDGRYEIDFADLEEKLKPTR